MENTKGYVYIMINPSYEGILKIGKTSKDPEDRAKELSSATGVATPFIVVYKRHFNNCHNAEKLAHNILEEKGVRVSTSREFFAIDIPDAINLILSIPDDPEHKGLEDQTFFSEHIEDSHEDLGETYFQQGDNYYYGFDDTFQDIEIALTYYEQSADLGYAEAFRQLGSIWKEKKGNTYKAIRYFQEGIKHQNIECYVELGLIYMDKYDNKFYNESNAALAWRKFFEAINSYTPESIPNHILSHVKSYLYYSQIYNQKIDSTFEKIIYKHKNCVITDIQNFIDFLETNATIEIQGVIAEYHKILRYLENLEEKLMLSVTDEKQLAKNFQTIGLKYFNGENSYPQNDTKALFLFKKSLSIGNTLSNVHIGNIWLNKGNKDKANTAWRCFYNNIYDTISDETRDITSEDKEQFIVGLYTMFSFAIEKEATDLIHPYYILAALHLGIIDYYCEKIDLLGQSDCYNINPNDVNNIDLKTLNDNFQKAEKERIQIGKVHSFIKESTYKIKEENNKNGNEGVFNGKIYRLDIN